jgi:hypothetical protein
MSDPILDLDLAFTSGVDSSVSPEYLPAGAVFSAINASFERGRIRCRPGYRSLAQLPDGVFQGAAYFEPAGLLPQIVVVISGVVYAAEYPFYNFRFIDGVAVSPTAKEVYFASVEQVVERDGPELDSRIRFLSSPKKYLLIQDGGTSPPVVFDGSSAFQVRNDVFGLPAGGPMAWVNDRLWVVVGGNRLVASDIANPLSFRETLLSSPFGGTDALTFSEPVVALFVMSSLEEPALLVFTRSETYAVSVGIRARDEWSKNKFLTKLASVGCVSSRSVTVSQGKVYWFHSGGVVSLDVALATNQTSVLPVVSGPMKHFEAEVSGILDSVAAGEFHGNVLFSVPVGDTNAHTWVLQPVVSDARARGSEFWAGVWVGTSPVQWLTGVPDGVRKIWHVSVNKYGNVLYESFCPERLDNGCPILWSVYTRGYYGLGSRSPVPPDMVARFRYARIVLDSISGGFDIGVWYSSVKRKRYKKIALASVKGVLGGLISGKEVQSSYSINTHVGQSRVLTTVDAAKLIPDENVSDVESSRFDDFDSSFVLRIVCLGDGEIVSITTFATPVPDPVRPSPDLVVEDLELSAKGIYGDVVSAGDLVSLPVNQLVSEEPDLVTAEYTATVTIPRWREASETVKASAVLSAVNKLVECQAKAAANAKAGFDFVAAQSAGELYLA